MQLKASNNMLKISILGDSISTFTDYNPDGYSVFYNEEMAKVNGLYDVSETWWNQVIKACDGELLVNDSFSGSRVSGLEFPSASSLQRILNLRKDAIPDIILVYIGFNDFGYGVPLKKKCFSNMNKLQFFHDSYDIMLKRLKVAYPNSIIVCGTLSKTFINSKPNWKFPEERVGKIPFYSYNASIRRVCRKHKVALAELDHIVYETIDGSHPTKKGHKTFAYGWIEELNNII